MKHVCLLAFLATSWSLAAADATGSWSGTMTVPAPDGPQQIPAHLILKQSGTTLSGTAGPTPERQSAIANGGVENGVLTFEIPAGPRTMRFTLKQAGDEITGEVSREIKGQVQKAQLAVKRIG